MSVCVTAPGVLLVNKTWLTNFVLPLSLLVLRICSTLVLNEERFLRTESYIKIILLFDSQTENWIHVASHSRVAWSISKVVCLAIQFNQFLFVIGWANSFTQAMALGCIKAIWTARPWDPSLLFIRQAWPQCSRGSEGSICTISSSLPELEVIPIVLVCHPLYQYRLLSSSFGSVKAQLPSPKWPLDFELVLNWRVYWHTEGEP